MTQRRSLRRRSLTSAVVLSSSALVVLGGGCNLILGLGDFHNECPEVAEGKECPDAGLCTPGDKIDCYTGPDGTEGKGICRAGTRTCGRDGLFGDCEGEQKPEHEVCGNGKDDDCNGKVDDCPCDPGKSYSCYTADDQNTKDVGECRSGMHVCQKDGVSYGPCTGEVLPKSEDYDKRGDENCDGIPSADTLWVDILTAPDATVAFTGVTSDPEGNTYVAGGLHGSIEVGGSTLTSSDGAGFLGKLDLEGKWKWARVYEGVAFGEALAPSNCLAYDSAHDEIVAIGETTGADLGSPQGALSQGVFVAGFDGKGAAKWSRGCSMGGTLDAKSTAVTVDDAGLVTFAGDFKGNLTCGASTLNAASSTSYSAFVVRVDASRQIAWAMSWGDGSNGTQLDQHVYGLAASSDGGTWAVGTLRGSVIIGTGTLTASGAGTQPDVLLIKIKPTGGYTTYAQHFGDSAPQEGSAIATDSAGNLYITGYQNGPIDFGAGIHTAAADGVFVAAFDAAASPLWAQSYGPSGQGLAVAAEPAGDVFLIGQLSGGINFGSGAFLSGSAEYSFLASFKQSSGHSADVKWSKFYGGDTADSSAGVVATAATLAARPTGEAKDVVAVGLFTQPADFGTGTIGPMQAFPDYSGFVIRVAP